MPERVCVFDNKATCFNIWMVLILRIGMFKPLVLTLGKCIFPGENPCNEGALVQAAGVWVNLTSLDSAGLLRGVLGEREYGL